MKSAFRESVNVALNNANLTGALGRFSEAYRIGRAKAYEGIDFEAVRAQIRDVKSAAACHLDDARRRYYKLTALGRKVLAGESERLEDLVRLIRAKRGLTKREAES